MISCSGTKPFALSGPHWTCRIPSISYYAISHAVVISDKGHRRRQYVFALVANRGRACALRGSFFQHGIQAAPSSLSVNVYDRRQAQWMMRLWNNKWMHRVQTRGSVLKTADGTEIITQSAFQSRMAAHLFDCFCDKNDHGCIHFHITESCHVDNDIERL